MDEEKKCFVIMPISDMPQYEPGHFDRVYWYIIKPAIIKAGFTPIRADEVQKTNFIIIDILKHIINSEMCICDLSSRNPNVLYELGIRQAFNLPVTIMRDTKTDRIFDIQGLRDIEYDENLRIDKVSNVIEIITNTIRNTYSSDDGDINSIVKFLGMLPSSGIVQPKHTEEADDPEKYDLEMCINKYIAEKKGDGLSQNTLKSYGYELNLFKDYIKMPVNKLTKEDIRSYLSYRNGTSDICTGTMQVIRGILKTFFQWLVDEKIISGNPVNRIKPYKLPEVYIEALSEIELQKIREACQTMREKAFIEILYSTGCTLSEIADLEIKRIDWDNNKLVINNNNKGMRTAFLSTRAIDVLKKYLETRDDECKEIFVTERKPYRRLLHRSIQKEIANIVRRTEINKSISPKTFRHTFALYMLNKGCPMNIVNTLLGNNNYTLTSEAYTKIITNENQIYKDYFQN